MPKWHLKRRNCRRSEIQQIETPTGAIRDSDGSSGRHRGLEPGASTVDDMRERMAALLRDMNNPVEGLNDTRLDRNR